MLNNPPSEAPAMPAPKNMKPLEIGDYNPEDAEAWFAQAESVFSMRGITSETKKAQILVQALPRKIYKLLWPSLDLDGREAEYTLVKMELLDMHGLSQQQCASKIFKFINVDTDIFWIPGRRKLAVAVSLRWDKFIEGVGTLEDGLGYEV